MKFSITRKINLANIDRDAYSYETEDIGVHDADSFEEACQIMDKLVVERTNFHKEKSAAKKTMTGTGTLKADDFPPNRIETVPTHEATTNTPNITSGPPAELL